MTSDTTPSLAEFSDALAALAASGGRNVAAITLPQHRPLSAILWRPGVAVTSEQVLADGEGYGAVLPGGKRVPAKLAGRDPGTNVAAFTLEHDAAPLERAPATAVGALSLLLGAYGDGGRTARLGMVRRLGPAWQSLAGGKIDQLIVLDARLGPDTEAAAISRLAALTGATGSLDDLTRALALAIREGRIALDDPALLAHLRRTTDDALRINNPQWLGS